MMSLRQEALLEDILRELRALNKKIPVMANSDAERSACPACKEFAREAPCLPCGHYKPLPEVHGLRRQVFEGPPELTKQQRESLERGDY